MQYSRRAPSRELGIIGCGRWGRNLIRVFKQLLGPNRVLVTDAEPGRAESAARDFDLEAVALEALITRSKSVVIATPPASHFDLAKRVLENGRHVLVEKPMAYDLASAEELVRIALRQRLILFVDHTFLFSEALQELRRWIVQGRLGQPLYFFSYRLAWGAHREDADAILDLAPHDFSILLYLFPDFPLEFRVFRQKLLRPSIDDAVLFFSGELPGQIVLSRTNPEKLRQFSVAFEKGFLMHRDGKLILTPGLVKPGSELVVPTVVAEDTSEPLLEMAKAFLYRVGSGHPPPVEIPPNGVRFSLEVMRLLDKARENG